MSNNKYKILVIEDEINICNLLETGVWANRAVENQVNKIFFGNDDVSSTSMGVQLRLETTTASTVQELNSWLNSLSEPLTTKNVSMAEQNLLPRKWQSI